jgi:hypothetical protein
MVQRTERTLQTDIGPDIRRLLHLATGQLHVGRAHAVARVVTRSW